MVRNLLRGLGLLGCLGLLAAGAYLTRGPGGPAKTGPVSHWVFDRAGVRGGEVRDRTGRLPSRLVGAPGLSGPEPAAREFRRHEVVLRKDARPGDPFLPAEAFSVAAWVRIDEVNREAGIVSAGRANRLGRAGFVLGTTARNRF